jgi:hypothetical protein
VVKEEITVLECPQHSPDFAPCELFMFPKLKLSLKQFHFVSLQDIQYTMATVELSGNDFQKMAEKLQ